MHFPFLKRLALFVGFFPSSTDERAWALLNNMFTLEQWNKH